jgi:hypothetical protein
MKNIWLFLFMINAMNSYSQIYETQVAIGLITGEEVYGLTKIPNGANRPIALEVASDLPKKIIMPEEIDYIIVDLLISEEFKENGEYVHQEERFIIVPINLKSKGKDKWYFAHEIIKGDLSYYGYQFKASKKEFTPNPNPFIGGSGTASDKYTFSSSRYLYKTLEGTLLKSTKSQPRFLQKEAHKLMPDCLELVKEIREQRRFEEDDVKNYILRYNQGCY